MNDDVCLAWQVLKCGRQDLARHIGDVQVAVPMMSRLDADMLRQGKQLKLVLQFGVGVEGIDISAVHPLLDLLKLPMCNTPC